AMLVWTNPYVMSVVLLAVLLVVLPTMWIGRRVRRLSRDSQDRVADSSALAAEVLNAVPVVPSYTAEPREPTRFQRATDNRSADLAMRVWTNPYGMSVVLPAGLLVVRPTMWIGRRVRRLPRDSQDRVADSSASAAEVLNAVPVVQSYTAEPREATRFQRATDN